MSDLMDAIRTAYADDCLRLICKDAEKKDYIAYITGEYELVAYLLGFQYANLGTVKSALGVKGHNCLTSLTRRHGVFKPHKITMYRGDEQIDLYVTYKRMSKHVGKLPTGSKNKY